MLAILIATTSVPKVALCGQPMLSLVFVALVTFILGAAIGALCVLVWGKSKLTDKPAQPGGEKSNISVDDVLKIDVPHETPLKMQQQDIHAAVAGAAPQSELAPKVEFLPKTTPAPKAASVSGAEELRKIAESLSSDNLRELVTDRLDNHRVLIEAWALEAVDTIDELLRVRSNAGADAEALNRLCDVLREMLAAVGCTVVDKDEWTPSLQRAVKTEKTLPPGAPPRIGKKLVTGLLVQGQLVRKQEVVLQTQTEQ